jgi:arylformamidase
MPTLIDLSHTVEAGMITYKGLPAPIICDYLSREASRNVYAEGTEFNIGKIEMVANTGTYVDSPFHRYANGKDLSELALESLAGVEGVLINCHERNELAITAKQLQWHDIKGKAVLIRTDWSLHWRTNQYFEGHPFLTKDAAQYLKDQGAVIVGIDTYNIDDTTDGRRPAHTILLGADIPICEHMCNFDQIPARPFRFFAVPVKVKGFGTFPVRAFIELLP